MQQPLIPIAFPRQTQPREDMSILAADIGGTKTDMAFFQVKNGAPIIFKEHRYLCKEWGAFEEIVRHFGQDAPKASCLCISFAGPIRDGRANGTNLSWDIDSREIGKNLGMDSVFLINDLEANCYGLAALKEEDLQTIYPGTNRDAGNAAVLSPGTGLGEGGLFWDGRAYHPFASEGGHTHFAARLEMDWELFRHLEKKYGHVSWERVVSGIGIGEILGFLREVKGRKTSNVLDVAMKTNDSAAAVGISSKEGCPLSLETLRIFIRYLAYEASNLSLKLKTTGGLYLGGGILPKIWNEEYQAIFNEHFFTVGRLNPLVKSVPVYLILNQKTALWGAGYFGAFSNG